MMSVALRPERNQLLDVVRDLQPALESGDEIRCEGWWRERGLQERHPRTFSVWTASV